MTSGIHECTGNGPSIIPVATDTGTSLIVRLIDRPLLWLERMRDRRTLAALDDRMLRDIGVSRSDVEAEARKPFWRG